MCGWHYLCLAYYGTFYSIILLSKIHNKAWIDNIMTSVTTPKLSLIKRHLDNIIILLGNCYTYKYFNAIFAFQSGAQGWVDSD